MSKTIDFRFGEKTCRVEIGFDFKDFRNALVDVSSFNDFIFVFDDNTERLFKDGIVKETGKIGELLVSRTSILRHGEKSKNWNSVKKILDRALELSLGRDSFFIGVGGGVLCDLTAFASSIYMRGTRLVLVPTTLLAMVDAAIGGKTGFNYGGFKNMIGTFYPADTVLVAVDTLKSLSYREYKSGLAEVIKTAMLGDEDLFCMMEEKPDMVKAKDPDMLEEIIYRCILYKGDIVEKDLRESKGRVILNLGHTFGHALESSMNFRKVFHGEAVAWGLIKAMELGVEMGLTKPDYAKRVRKLLELYNFKLEYETVPVESIVSNMYGDKKKRRGSIRFILQRELGDNLIEEGVSDELMYRVLSI